jgi:hypothetical protein
MREHVQFEERGLFTLAQEIVDLPRLAQGLERPTEITSE